MGPRGVHHRIFNTEKTKNPRSSTEVSADVFRGQQPCPLIGITRYFHALRAKRNIDLLRGPPCILRLRVENRQVKQHRRISLCTVVSPAPLLATPPFHHRKLKTCTAKTLPDLRQARRPRSGHHAQ